MTVAPINVFPERAAQAFARQAAPSIPMNKGPLRFEEGVATDTDLPNNFARGAYNDTTFAPGAVNHNNPQMQFKHADETMRERAHVGSSSWIEAPAMLGDFVVGSQAGMGMPEFERAMNPGTRQARRAATVIFE